METIYFWHEIEEYGCFSNWYPCVFVIDDFRYSCVEQYMMARKAKMFHDSENYTRILRSDSPEEYKALGRAVKPFDPAAWGAVSMEVVKTACMAKFSQDPFLRKKLLSTGDALIVEASPYDALWGIGLDEETARQMPPECWPGENRLGQVLMAVREELRSQAE